MRVTTASTYLITSQSLGGAKERVSDVQAKLASGKEVNKWSDDAPAATAASRYRAEEADWDSFRSASDDALGWLGTADGSLQSMSKLLTRVKELAVTAGNGALSASSREAAAEEITALRRQLVDLGNTQHLGRPLFGGFGGTAGIALAVTDGAVSYEGDDGQVLRQISPTVRLPVNVSGSEVFGFADGEDVFTVLADLEQAARTGDTAGLAAGQDALLRSHDRVLRGLAQVGSTVNRVESAQAAGQVAKVELAQRRSALEEIDLAEAVLTLSAAEAGYQAALGAAAKANLPSLADFLK